MNSYISKNLDTKLKNHFLDNPESNLDNSDNLDNLDNLEKELEKKLDNDSLDDLEKELDMIIKNKPIIDIKLSDEQIKIINSNSNIKVDAVAGSGKTTTILHMGMANPTKKIFQITYNNLLKREVRKKAKRLCVENMEIHTYHSLSVKYYDPLSYTDEEIKKVLSTNKQINPNIESKPFDILFIDETQDMILDYYRLIKKFISDTNSKPQIIILGDKYQGIYDFKGANVKFLTLADKIWNVGFKNFNLSTSYRLTNQIAWFVNNVMLGHDRIKTVKNGMAVDYYISNPFKIYKKIGKYLLDLIKANTIQPSDIFILIPSLKTLESPYKKLENYLVKHGIKCITPISDDTKLDDKTISNKVVFTTYHQAKGRERKIVILYNFDNTYMEYYTRESIKDRKICPNILYVGATRASEKLILIQDVNSKPLSFLNLTKLKQNIFLNIIQTDLKNPNLNPNPNPNLILNRENLPKTNLDIKKINVTDMVKFISPNTLEIIMDLVDNNLFTQINPPNQKLTPIQNKIEIENNGLVLWEDVSDLNGLVIPAILETKINNTTSTIENYVRSQFKQPNIFNEYSKYSGKINIPCLTIKDFLKVGNIYNSLQNKLHAKLAQIKKYNWLNDKVINECHKYMIMINSNTLFEITIKSELTPTLDWFEYEHEIYGTIQLRGRLDAISSDSVWEFKCVDYLSIEHKLQLIVYYWMWIKANMSISYGSKKFYLMNIKSGQYLQLNTDKFFIIEQVVEILFDEKYLKKKELNDFEFINMCNSINTKKL
jgi:hypothetical protein